MQAPLIIVVIKSYEISAQAIETKVNFVTTLTMKNPSQLIATTLLSILAMRLPMRTKILSQSKGENHRHFRERKNRS